jgi:hypothetical protein
MAMMCARRCLLVLVIALAACSKTGSSDLAIAAAPAAQSRIAAEDAGAAPAAMLAYEHSARIELQADRIAVRLQEARDACTGKRFGDCVILNVQQQGGEHASASLGMRLVPAGVEPMIALAGAGARLGSRSTQAEDLAVVVRDNSLAQDRLRKELARLQEFQQRPDLAVADMIALSQRMAEAEAQLQAAEQEGAQHRRRIDTQLLTLHFQPPGGEAGRNEVAQALRDFGGILSLGTAWLIRAAAFLIPLVLVIAVLVAGMRRWRTPDKTKG